MQLATQLLITAQMLINLVIANPSLPQNVKVDALNQAFASITSAQAELNKPQTTQVDTQTVTQSVQTVAPVLQTPTFGSIIKSMEIETTITDERQPSPDNLHGFFGITVRVKEGGVYKKVAVTMSAQDQLPALDNSVNNTRVTDTQSGVNANDWSTVFLFTPTSSGNKDVTFTYGETSKTITINAK